MGQDVANLSPIAPWSPTILCMVEVTSSIRFVDPDNPPSGLDLSRLPVGVDVNELIARELVSEGELVALVDENEAPRGGALPLADQQAMIDVIQEIVDSHCFDPINPER